MTLLVADTRPMGCATAPNPKVLNKGIGVDAQNLDSSQGDFRGRRAAPVVYTLVGYSGVQQEALYRMGRETASDTQYWLAYAADVDFARSLLASDPLERTYGTGTTIFSEPVYTDNTFLTSEPHGAAGEGYALGIDPPGTGMTATVATAGAGSNETRLYVTTFVRYNDDESAPSDPTRLICPIGSTVTLASFPTAPGSSAGVDRRRFYVSTGGDYRLCAEVAVATTSTTDTGTRGAILQTGGATNKPAWLAPPNELSGLIELWNGMHGGFTGKSYMVCVPYNPHAWPVEYRRQVPDRIVGTARYGQTWVLATTGIPRLVEGRAPEGMQDRPINLPEACLSKRSVVGVGHGVCWASSRGLCYHGTRGTFVMTDGIFTQAQWRALVPSTIIGAHWQGYYIGFYNDGTRKSFMINTLAPEQGVIFTSQGAFAIFSDPISDTLYILDSGNQIRKWDSGTVGSATFKSKVFRLQRGTNPGAARIVGTTYPVNFSLWADGDLKVNARPISSDEAFKLPGGYTAEEIQYQIVGTGPIEGVFIGEEFADLP